MSCPPLRPFLDPAVGRHLALSLCRTTSPPTPPHNPYYHGNKRERSQSEAKRMTPLPENSSCGAQLNSE